MSFPTHVVLFSAMNDNKVEFSTQTVSVTFTLLYLHLLQYKSAYLVIVNEPYLRILSARYKKWCSVLVNVLLGI